MTERSLIWHWRQDDAVKNFGDYLADFLVKELFLPISAYDGPVHVIGSVIADFLVPEGKGENGVPHPRVVFWGCGVRDETGLSDDRFENARILAVRGPLTASVLRVGAVVPQGDPAFLLPALYTPEPSAFTAGKTVCIPHFWDRRPDEDLRATGGCDVLLRTNIAGGKHDLRRVIDAIAAADFVLTASLHGAVVAAAYGVPFAFWDNGHVDLPFKWKDLASFLSIPADFYGSLAEARPGYEKNIAPSLKIPSLWPLLAVAPFPLRPSALTRLLNHELAQWPGEEAHERLKACLQEFERREEDAAEQAQVVTDTIDLLKTNIRQIGDEQAQALAEGQRLRQRIDDLGGAHQLQVELVHERELALTAAEHERELALAAVERERELASGALASLQGEKDAAEAAYQDLQQRFDDLGGAHQVLDAAVQERDRIQAELVQERDQAQEAAKAQLAEFEARREALNGERERERDELLRTLTAFVGLATRLPNAIGNENAGLLDDSGLFHEVLATLRSAIAGLHERNLGAEAANAELSVALTELRDAQEAEGLRSQVAEVREDLERRLAEAESQSRKALDDAVSEAEGLRSQVAEVREDLERRLAEAESQSRKALDEIAVLQQRLDRERTQRSGLETTLSDRDRHLRISFEEIAELSRRSDASEKQMAALAQAKAEVEMSIGLTTEAYYGIANSTTWRMARKVTGLVGRLPPGLRRGLRHALHRAVRLTRRVRGLETGVAPLVTTEAEQPKPHEAPPSAAPTPVERVWRPALDAGPAPETIAVYAFARTEHAAELDAFIRSTSASVVVAVDRDAARILGGVETFESLFEAHPMAVAACGVVLDDRGRIASSGGAILGGSLTAAEAGEDPAGHRFASVRATDALWPEFVAVNVDAYLHIGGLDVERGVQEALFAFGVAARERGLELTVNPFATAGRIGETGSVRLPEDLNRRSGALIRKPKPKVLFTDAVTPTPDRDSGSQDIYWFMRIFQTLGYEVTFLPAQNLDHAGRYTDELRMLGIFCPLSPEIEAGWTFLRDHGPSFKLIMMYRVSSACHLIDPARQFAPQAKIVFDTVDLHFLREMRAAEHAGSEEMRQAAERTKVEELRIMTMSDATILLSSMEFDHVAELAPHVNGHLIPIVRPIPGRSAPIDGRKDMMFVGGFKHLPNIDAVQYLCGDIWPKVRSRLSDAQLLIIGADAPDEIQAFHDPANGVEFVGFVDDLSPYYDRVRLNLASLRYGAGVKGKVVASLSVGLPTVASPTAVEGMPVVDGRDVLVGDGAEAFADAVVRLYTDADLWLELSDNGVKAASEAFSIGAVRQRLEGLLNSIGLGPN